MGRQKYTEIQKETERRERENDEKREGGLWIYFASLTVLFIRI